MQMKQTARTAAGATYMLYKGRRAIGSIVVSNGHHAVSIKSDSYRQKSFDTMDEAKGEFERVFPLSAPITMIESRRRDRAENGVTERDTSAGR